MFSRATLNGVDPMNSLTLKNVSSVANTESEDKLSLTPVGFWKSLKKNFTCHMGDEILEFL